MTYPVSNSEHRALWLAMLASSTPKARMRIAATIEDFRREYPHSYPRIIEPHDNNNYRLAKGIALIMAFTVVSLDLTKSQKACFVAVALIISVAVGILCKSACRTPEQFRAAFYNAIYEHYHEGKALPPLEKTRWEKLITDFS